MRKFLILIVIAGSIAFLFGCNYTLNCERHFLPKGFIGDVMVYFNQKNGQRSFDKNGCVMYHISSNGKCYSGLPYKEGTALPDSTFKYFEFVDENHYHELPEFEANEFYKDSLQNHKKKYVYFIASGYKNPNYFYEYYVDYGINHKKYNNQ